MEIRLIDIKKFIVANNLEEVSNPITFEKGSIPTVDGVLSTDIFGTSMKERKRTFAYVDLNGHFLQPIIYKVLKRLDRNFEHCVAGTKNFIVKDGKLVEDEEKGKTGLEFLYKVWDELEFRKNESHARSSRVELVTYYKKDTIFTKQWLIIPPFYRDVNLSQGAEGKASHHEVNDMYSKLLRLSANLDGNGFANVLTNTYNVIQHLLIEIYDLFKGNLEKKNGLQRKSLLGKSVDYGARLVISAPRFTSESPSTMDISFYRTGIPLSISCAIFKPFIVPAVQRFFTREFGGRPTYPIIDEKGNEVYVELKDPITHFNEDFIMKKLERYIRSTSDRYEIVRIPTVDKKYDNKYAMSFRGKYYDKNVPETESPLANRPLTWTDIFYQICYDEIEKANKMIWITRYPILDYFGMLTTYVHIQSTNKTSPMYIDKRVYPYYPVINMKDSAEKISTNFVDTATMSNLYLDGLGGDYDGDQVSIRGVFSQEAQKESEEIMYGKANILNIYGGMARKNINEGIQTVYMMTRRV